MSNEHQTVAEQLQALLNDHEYTSEQIAEAAIHALYGKLSAGAAHTFEQVGRGAILMDLRDLANGYLDTSYVPLDMLHHLNEESALFADAETATLDYDPEREFVIIIWQEMLIMIYRLAQV